MIYDKRVKFLYDTLDLFLSVIRLFSQTYFKKTRMIKRQHDRCIIMVNGPSLIQTLEENKGNLQNIDIIAINDMALSPEFVEYKPSIYVLCDHWYWFEFISDPGVSVEQCEGRLIQFYQQLADKTTWPLQLYIPYEAKKKSIIIRKLLSSNVHISLSYYNKTRFEGCKSINYFVYKRQWGMPRTQNILHATLMLAIYSKYKEIYLAGADNDWMKNLWVDEQNRLRLDDIHFYNMDGEKRIIASKYYEQCASLYIVFKNYVDISEFAKYSGVEIINLNPLSFIDAFEKKSIVCLV